MSVSVISWVAELQQNSYFTFYSFAFKKTKTQTCETVGRFGGTTRGQVCLEVGVSAEGDRAGA